ncbi:hypothetical protein [Microbacterium sp. bgisy207]|uniref:hypothetical protein n=1 Tax=Microbacterium sp. bgisy207 TaxID=3413800 RepID=UPI003EBC2E63
MPRPYQTWTRAQIADRTLEIATAKTELDAHIARVKSGDIDVSDLAGRGHSPEMLETIKSMRRSNIIIELTNQHISYSKEQQALNFELHVRDSPDLVREFGPGAD